jgi:protein-S-isoprenylcysteine O-methyltransferase Ste14
MISRLFVWLGGALFVASLAFCAWSYLVTWSTPGVFMGWRAVAANAALFSVFALHHSVLARERVKAQLAWSIPERLMRSVYVWIASALFVLVCAWWQPTGVDVYHLTGSLAAAFAAVQLLGLALIVWSVHGLDPLELAGIRDAAAMSALQIAGPYRWVRHPLYLGWMLTVFAAAHMTGDRLAFAVISSIYLVLAVPWEEQSLRRAFGGGYETYTRHVRWRIIPFVY